MENHAVRLRNLHLRAIHNQQPLFQIRRKKSERSRILIQPNQVLIIREKRHILRILPAHRKTQKLRQQPRFFINLINSRAVISRIGAAQIPEIIGKIQRAGRGASRMIIIQRTDRLYFFKERIVELI